MEFGFKSQFNKREITAQILLSKNQTFSGYDGLGSCWFTYAGNFHTEVSQDPKKNLKPGKGNAYKVGNEEYSNFKIGGLCQLCPKNHGKPDVKTQSVGWEGGRMEIRCEPQKNKGNPGELSGGTANIYIHEFGSKSQFTIENGKSKTVVYNSYWLYPPTPETKLKRVHWMESQVKSREGLTWRKGNATSQWRAFQF